MGPYEWKKSLEKERTIVIYGTGIVGKRFFRWLRENDITADVVFANTKPKEPSYLGIPIIKADCISEYYPDALIVVATKENFQREIMEYLSKLQIKKYFCISEEVFQIINNVLSINLEEYDEIIKKFANEQRLTPRTLLRYEVHIAEHCNLNCRGCYHCSPLAKPELLTVTEYERDCARLAELYCGEMESITLLGGEPLLHPEITEFFRITRKHFSVGRISLLTNGILLPNMSEEFWVAAKKYQIDILTTKYPINVDYEGIKRKAEQYGVYCNNFNMIVDEKGNKLLENYQFDLEGRQPVEENFKKCYRGNTCITLKHGRLYTCVMSAHLHHLKEYFGLEKIHISERNSIDIYEAKSAEEISEFLTRPIPICRYCKITKEKKYVPFQVSKKCLDEWL